MVKEMPVLEPKVIRKESFQIIGYHVEANLREIEEGKLDKKTLFRLQEAADKIMNKRGNHVYLIQLYPVKENFNALEDRFTQIIGYEITAESEVPEGAILHTVPENIYVSYTHQGPEADLYKTYDYIYGKWLRENGYVSLGYDLELWDERYKPTHSDNEIDLFVPIKKQ